MRLYITFVLALVLAGCDRLVDPNEAEVGLGVGEEQADTPTRLDVFSVAESTICSDIQIEFTIEDLDGLQQVTLFVNDEPVRTLDLPPKTTSVKESYTHVFGQPGQESFRVTAIDVLGNETTDHAEVRVLSDSLHDYWGLEEGTVLAFEYVEEKRNSLYPPQRQTKGVLTWEVVSSITTDSGTLFKMVERFEGSHRERRWRHLEWEEWRNRSWERSFQLQQSAEGITSTEHPVIPLRHPIPRFDCSGTAVISTKHTLSHYGAYQSWELKSDTGVEKLGYYSTNGKTDDLWRDLKRKYDMGRN